MDFPCILVLLISWGIIATGHAQKINYDGYQMVRIAVSPDLMEEGGRSLLAELQNFDGVISVFGPPMINHDWTFLIAPYEAKEILQFLDTNWIQYRVTIPDVGRHIANEKVHYGSREGKIRWDEYYDLAGIYEYLEEQATLHPSLVTLENIGTTFEGRNLTVIKISNSTTPSTKPVVWIDANMHAREWITGAVCTHIIDQLLNGPDTEMQALVNDFDFYILPMANPDGYVYTHNVDRFWRKTRSNRNLPSGCVGTDPNRNYDAFWMEAGGASNDPCSLVYAGPEPFSEPETNATANFLRTFSNRLAFYLSLHSAGQYILLPTGRDATPISEYENYKTIADKAAAAHANRYNMTFVAGNIVELMYIATGSSMDWAYTKLTPTAKLHFTYELRDKGQFGHLLPADQILPSCEEFIDGFKVTIAELKLMP